MKLNPKNRWVQLANHFPWDRCVKIYTRHFSNTGRSTINPRIVIGSLIIKHKLNLSDEETVQLISENPYMQFFLGLDEFYAEPLFAPSLFVEWRKKLGNDTFNEFSDILSRICYGDKMTKGEKTEVPKNKGKIKLDASVADQNIAYPTDLTLLNKAREKTEGIIDILYDHVRDQIKVKPRTYRKVARKKYLAESKKKQVNKKSLRSAIRYHLNCLDRNIRSINEMLDMLQENPLPHKKMRDFWVIQTLNDQQREMYDNKINRCDDRIVNISQPYVRPILRGKAGKKIEFGTKLGLSLVEGIAKAETLSWDAYNESADLIPHVESYKKLHGYYPELVQVDKIYGTNKNRKWCRERNIRMTVVQKGKQPEQTQYEKRKQRKEFNERNEVEGKIGQAKQSYGMNNIKAKLSKTSQSWIGLIIFVTNHLGFRFPSVCDHIFPFPLH
ncbi:IS5 family transposase [Membranicola marinus]|uniref:IS5 family transposase n=2 Tax=Membranihabitans marinus TaxID=1227546 RepID=A0A953HQE5_9BACT|nr:IS5 family transposase [Membranihabitans marinus]